MARTIKDSSLETRTARLERLRARGKPYYRLIEEGLHLGYRKPRGRKGKPAGGGKWVMRRYIGDQSYAVETIGIADDFDDADGAAILSFSQAQNLARERFKRGAQGEARNGPYTVAVALKDYFEALSDEGKEIHDAQLRADAFIVPVLGHRECSEITAKDIRGWLSALAKKPPRVRTKKDGKQAHREDFDPDDPESVRKRQASANRVLNTLKAALSHAFNEGRVTSDVEWRRVKPFKNVNTPHIRFLTVAQSKRLINATGDEFRPVVEAALQTGCRYGELCRLQVQDFQPDTKTLAIRKTKSGRARTVYLTDDGARLFQRLAAGRADLEFLLRHNDGRPWAKSEQNRPMIEACERAGIAPHVGFHVLRHSYASMLVQAGVPLKVVAEALGHASTVMTERHYAGLSQSHVADSIRANLPKFGTRRSNVIGLR